MTTSILLAQVTTSTITGTIKTTTDESLVGATIKATHVPTGTIYTTISSKGGQFNIENMRPGGPYIIEITFVGFETQKFEDVYLKLAESFYLNVQMQKAVSSLENVVITTSLKKNPILNASRTGAVTNLSRSQIEIMPSISRSINDLTRATPQANGVSIAGGDFRQNNFTIDGADFNNSFGISTNGAGNLPGGGTPISLDAVDEISVNISPFDIRQSGFIGGAINAVTRSGTNTFSGSVYKYWRNQNNQGNHVGNTTVIRNPFSFTQWGFRLGGPVIKNKLFFFFNYETDNQPKQVQTNFAATSAAPFGSSSNIARPLASDLDAISSYLLNTYNYVTGPYDHYSTQTSTTRYLGRLDWNINKNNHFMVRYSQVEGGSPSPPSTSTSGSNLVGVTGNRQDINSLFFSNSIYYQGINFYSLAAELTSKISRRLSNVIRATYTFQNESRSTPSTIFPFVDILNGMTSNLNGGTTYTSFGYELFSYGNLRKVKMHSYVDNLTWNSGKHSVTAGIQLDYSQTTNGFMRFGTSYYVFNSWNDFITGANPYNFAQTYSFLPGFAQAFPSFKFAQYSAYAQDEVAFNKKFHLTFGIRFDQPTYPNVSQIVTNPYVLAVNFADGAKMNTGVLPSKTIMASPRIGFNYDLYGDRSLQIRGGTGIFTGKVPFVWIVSQSGDNGMLQTTVGYNGTANTPGPFSPDPKAYLPHSTPIPGSIIPTTIEVLTPNYKFPQTWKTSLGLDKKLAGNTIFTVEAIFNKDLKAPYFTNVNLVNPSPLNVSGYPDNRLIYPASTNGNTNNSIKFINPVMSTPAAGTVVFVPNGTSAPAGSSIGAANVISMKNGTQGFYFSLNFELQKQLTKGLSFFAAYTKSFSGKIFDGGGDQPLSAWQGTAISQGPNVPELSYASFVNPDRLSSGLTLRKEYIKHLATTISVFYNGSSNGRFSYVYGGDFNRDGVTGNDLIYIPKNPSEITFTPFTYPNGVTYTAAQQSAIFFNYIAQDKYLRSHQGQMAERNGGQYPWHNEVDFKFLQDLFVNVGKTRNTVQFGIDIFNFGNFLNHNWGKYKILNATSGQILVPTNATSGTIFNAGGTIVPTFRLAYDTRNAPIISSFRDDVSINSTYYMQFSIRYIFGN